MNSSSAFLLVLVGLFCLDATQGARMKSAFLKLYSSSGAALVADLIEQPEGPSPACVDKVANAIREDFANQDIDVENGIFEKMGDSRTFERMCKIFRENVQTFEGCPKREKESPSALIVLLKLVCEHYHADFKTDLECVADMEKSMTVRCQESCLDQEAKTLKAEDSETDRTPELLPPRLLHPSMCG